MTMRLSASNAGRLMACPASGNLDVAILGWVEPIRDESVGAKAIGTLYHEYFANIARLPARDIYYLAQALQYVANIRSQRRFKVMVEQTVKATWLQTSPTTTADLVLYTQDEIHVLDLKTGKIPVEVHENEQLLYYAACYGELAPKAKGVTVHIVQPWANNMKSWHVTATRLGQFMDDARAAEQKLLAKDTTFGPSDHCKFCPANPHSRGDKGRPLCPTMLQMLYPQHVDEDAILDLE